MNEVVKNFKIKSSFKFKMNSFSIKKNVLFTFFRKRLIYIAIFWIYLTRDWLSNILTLFIIYWYCLYILWSLRSVIKSEMLYGYALRLSSFLHVTFVYILIFQHPQLHCLRLSQWLPDMLHSACILFSRKVKSVWRENWYLAYLCIKTLQNTCHFPNYVFW